MLKCEPEANGIQNHCYAAIRHTDISVKPYTNRGDGKVGRVIARRFTGTAEILEINVEDLERPLNVRLKAGELPHNDDLVLVTVDPKLMMIFPQD